MNLDFSMVELEDVVEYFKALFKAFLKFFKIELPEGSFNVNIGDIEIGITPNP